MWGFAVAGVKNGYPLVKVGVVVIVHQGWSAVVIIDQYEYPNQESESPVGSMTFENAKEACRQQNKRLCSEAEWTLACEGPEWKGYPYGSQYRSGTLVHPKI